MTAKQAYNQIINSSVNELNPNFMQADSALHDYYISHCYHPVNVKVFDSHLGRFVLRKCPCGHCYHCRETKINEWVTRLYAHSDYYPYIYFITLTLRSFDEARDPYEEYLFNYLSDAYYHYDDLNITHMPCYSPSYFSTSLYQNFFKRLRKNTDIKGITYFAATEYGERFARPHMHIILFSPAEISESAVRSAWGLQLSLNNGVVHKSTNDSHSVFFPFGKIDFQDMIQAGDFASSSLLLDGKNTSAKNCFMYVAKYVGKQNFNYKRIDLLYEKFKNSLEEYDFQFDCTPTTLKEFRYQFRPRITCSRGTPIGSLFVNDHIDEMAQGVFARPVLQDKGAYIVPSYFRRKASEHIFSLRTFSPAKSISKGNLPSLATALATNIRSELINDYHKTVLSYSNSPQKSIACVPYVSESRLIDYLNDPNCFVDVKTRSRFLIAVQFQGMLPESFVAEFKYSRSHGWYVKQYHDLEKWCLHYLSSMPLDFTHYMESLNKTLESDLYYQMITEYYEKYSIDPNEKVSSIVSQIERSNDSFNQLKDISHLQKTNL